MQEKDQKNSSWCRQIPVQKSLLSGVLFACLILTEKYPSAVTAVSLGIRTRSRPTPSSVAGWSHWKLFCMDILFLIPVNQLFPSPSYLSSKGLSLSASKLSWDPAFVTSAKHVLDQKRSSPWSLKFFELPHPNSQQTFPPGPFLWADFAFVVNLSRLAAFRGQY